MCFYISDRRAEIQPALFLHIPRTGGTTVRQALGHVNGIKLGGLRKKVKPGVNSKHPLPGHLNSEVHWRMEFAFAFVRHPVSYYKSVWKWLSKSSLNSRLYNDGSWHPYTRLAALFHPNFNVWVERVCEEVPAFATRLFEAYVGPDGGEFVDYVGKTENLKVRLQEVLDLIGLDVKIKMPTRQNAIKKEVQISNSTRELIESVERDAIRRFYN